MNMCRMVLAGLFGVAAAWGASGAGTTSRPQPKEYGEEGAADMGSYEYVPKARSVWKEGKAVPPYESWADAANDIQSALDVSADGDLVVVEAGTYGAFAASNAVTLTGLRGAGETIIDAEGAGRGAVMASGGVLEGFTVRNGDAGDGAGGGIWAGGGRGVGPHGGRPGVDVAGGPRRELAAAEHGGPPGRGGVDGRRRGVHGDERDMAAGGTFCRHGDEVPPADLAEGVRGDRWPLAVVCGWGGVRKHAAAKRRHSCRAQRIGAAESRTPYMKPPKRL